MIFVQKRPSSGCGKATHEPQNNRLPALTHIYPHTKFKSSRYNTFEVIGKKYDFCAKKGHPADVERLATSLGKEAQGQYYT